MSFLILLVAVLMTESLGPLNGSLGDRWIVGWKGWLAGQPLLAGRSRLLHVLTLLVPVALLALVLEVCGGWLFGLVVLVLNLLVLRYAFGRDGMAITQYRDTLARGDVQAAWHEAGQLVDWESDPRADSWPALHDQGLAAVAYRCFERYFPVMFWFVVLGLPGALFYRLSSLVAADGEGEDGAIDRQLVWVLEWVPLRLLGPVLALMGNFSAAMRAWRETLFAVDESSAQVLVGVVRSALLTEASPSPDESAREVDAVRALFRRALIFTLGLIALIELL